MPRAMHREAQEVHFTGIHDFWREFVIFHEFTVKILVKWASLASLNAWTGNTEFQSSMKINESGQVFTISSLKIDIEISGLTMIA